MKKLNILAFIFLSFLLFSCLGGGSVKQIPRHMSAGSKQMNKGIEWYQKGCYRKSLEYFFKAYELNSASDILDGVAMSLNNIGTVYRILGNYEEAIQYFDEAHTIYSELNNQREAIKALSNKAATLICMEKLDEATQVIDETLQMLPAKRNRGLLIPVLQNKGVLLTKQGAYEAAEELLAYCLDQTDSLDPMGKASLHFAVGNLMLKTERPVDAIASFEKALVIDRKLGFYKGMADDLLCMGQAYTQLGQHEKAVKSLKRSIKIFALIDHGKEVNDTMKLLREAAQKACIDISLTEAFVERWRQGKLYESPCRD